MHEVLVNRLGGLSLPRKSAVRLTDRPNMSLEVYRGRKNNNTTTTTTQQHFLQYISFILTSLVWSKFPSQHSDESCLSCAILSHHNNYLRIRKLALVYGQLKVPCLDKRIVGSNVFTCTRMDKVPGKATVIFGFILLFSWFKLYFFCIPTHE